MFRDPSVFARELVVLCACFGMACTTKPPSATQPFGAAGSGATSGVSTSVAGAQPNSGGFAGGTEPSSQTGGAASVSPIAGSHAETGGAGSSAHAGHGDVASVAADGGAASSAASVASGVGGVGGVSGSVGMTGTGATGNAASAPTLPPVTSVEGDGPFATKQDLATGPKGASGLFQPAQLGQNGLKHPIFLFGCGGMSNPSQYATPLTRIASHGFVVLADVSAIGDDATVFKASLDWLIAQNGRAASPFYDKLDTSKIAAGGHSIGSVNAFAFALDPRLTTTIHVAGGSLDDVNNPNAPTTGMGGKALVHPAAYICDSNDVFGNDTKAAADYTTTTAPVFFTLLTGTDHIGVFSAALPAIVAWLRWQLAGETERRRTFLEPSGEFCTAPYMSMSKNW